MMSRPGWVMSQLAMRAIDPSPWGTAVAHLAALADQAHAEGRKLSACSGRHVEIARLEQLEGSTPPGNSTG